MLGVAREPVDLGAGRGSRPIPSARSPRARRPGSQPARDGQHEPGRLLAELVALGFVRRGPTHAGFRVLTRFPSCRA
jgi:hypothetical protein